MLIPRASHLPHLVIPGLRTGGGEWRPEDNTHHTSWSFSGWGVWFALEPTVATAGILFMVHANPWHGDDKQLWWMDLMDAGDNFPREKESDLFLRLGSSLNPGGLWFIKIYSTHLYGSFLFTTFFRSWYLPLKIHNFQKCWSHVGKIKLFWSVELGEGWKYR